MTENYRIKRFSFWEQPEEFHNLLTELYPPDSPRFKLGFDPVEMYCEGLYLLYSKDSDYRQPIGRFAFYENPELYYHGLKAASIGSYECIEDQEASSYLLSYAVRLARGKSYAYLIGPMEGSTWNNYRFSLDHDYPNFLMEPYHHLYYNQQFRDSGFEDLASFFSARVTSPEVDESRYQQLHDFYLKQGARIREMDMENLDEDLGKLGKASLEGFQDNFLYTPIEVEDFVQKYRGLKDLIQPDLVQIVEDDEGKVQAFIFCIPDYLDPSAQSLIIKTLVKRNSRSFAGIGRYLNLRAHKIARDKGYSQVIHALMFADNISLQISRKNGGELFKQYQLYALAL